jgi:hypothetical protein
VCHATGHSLFVCQAICTYVRFKLFPALTSLHFIYRMTMYTPGGNVQQIMCNVRGPFEKFVDWRKYAAVMLFPSA